MNKSGSPPPSPLGGVSLHKLSGLLVAVVAASLLTAGPVPAAADDTQPTPSPEPTTAPSTTTFPKPDDPDADLRAAIAEARKQNKPVEVLSKGTESSRSWAYPDGHITTDTYAGPARVKQADGSFEWIDTTLVERDGTFQPKTAKADVRFSQGGDTKLASLENADKAQLFALEWPTPLPKPRIEGNKAIYAGAAGPTADLVVTALATGFRHDVVLHERPTGPVEFRLPVRTKGLKLSETKVGGLKLTDAKGKTVASAAEPFMTEAPSSDAKTLPHQRGEIDASVVTAKNGGQVLVIKPDPAFLADEKTTYPVTVDPTVSLTATTDAWVQSKTGAADATGSELNIGTGTYYQSERRCTGSVCTYTNKIYPNFLRGYVGFGSISGFSGKYVDSATIQLLGSYAGPCGSRTLTALPITSSWSTSSLSWSGLPPTTSTGAVTITPSCGSSTVTSFNVTQMAKNWAAGSPSYGVELKSTEDSRSSWPDDPNPVTAQYWSFNSVESGQSPPKLTVNYLLPPEIPTVTGESIDSIAGNDAISRSSDVKVSYKSTSIDGKKIDYLVSISDPTRPIPLPPVPSPSPSPTSSPSPSPTSTAIPGLVAAYGMNEGSGTTVADASGSGNTGTASATSWAAGKFGQALSFNGTSSWVTVNDSPSLRLTNKITMEAWVKPTSIFNWHTILMKEASPDDSSYALYASITANGGIPIGPATDLQIDGYYDGADTPTKLPTNTWSHVAGTYDGTSTKIYVNGTLAAETTLSGDVTNGAAPLRIGGNNPFGDYFSGLIDEVRIYKTALTQGQIQADMNNPVGAAPAPDNPPSAPGTVTAVAGPDTINLSWDAALDDRGAVTYQVHRSKTAGFTPSTTTRVATVSNLTYADSGMVQGQYYYRVVAIDSAGQAGPASNEVSALTSAQLFPPVTGANSGQVVNNEFNLGSPDSFKFKVKACLTGITPRMCNETPYYRITTDAPYAPTDTGTGLGNPQIPILSAMVARPSGGPVTAKFYLTNSLGQPVGSVPLAQRTVPGRERVSVEVPEGTVQGGQAYSWRVQTCVQEICSSKSEPETFTVDPVEGEDTTAPVTQTVTLAQDHLYLKSGKSSPTACGGAPCLLTDTSTIHVDGTSGDATVATLAINLSDIPDGAMIDSALLDLGSATCEDGTCPADTAISLRPLSGSVTSDTKASDLAGMAVATTYTATVANPQVNVTDDVYAWFLVETSRAGRMTFGEAAASVPVSVKISYVSPGPPSPVMNLAASPGDSSATASWGVPESNGSMSVLDGYDVEVLDAAGALVDSEETEDATIGIDGLTNDATYTVRVRSRTRFGDSAWSSTTVTPKAPPGCGASTYTDAIVSYYQAQDAVLEGQAADVWSVSGMTPNSRVAGAVSVLNAPLTQEFQSLGEAGITRSDSTVTLKNVVVSPSAGGKIQVSATVERTWKETTSAAASGASVSARSVQTQDETGTPGQVEPRDSSDNVTYTFDPCDRLNVTLEMSDQNEDSSDYVDTGTGSSTGDGADVLARYFGVSSRSSLAATSATKSTSALSTATTCPQGRYWTGIKIASKLSKGLAKGMLLEVVGGSRWQVCKPRPDIHEWNVDQIGAVTTVYTNSSFRNPKIKKNGKLTADNATKKRNDYIRKWSNVELATTACFRVDQSQVTPNFEIGVGGEFGFPIAAINVSGAAGVTMAASAAKDCGATAQAASRVGGQNASVAFRTSMWSVNNSAIATCFTTAGVWCNVGLYRQSTTGTFNFAKSKGVDAHLKLSPTSGWLGYAYYCDTIYKTCFR
ncbi:LamG-like jellyroll fold domain-containing protein [Microtetraspora malaysiensis]|uniref:LamG-like jellyroll fold domain-containing protein n=1 Tax=Microtetraspora malaysiensis TaxID=161358 RepID=UPI003D8C71F4